MSRISLRVALTSLLVLHAALLWAQVPDAPFGSTPAADGTTFRVWAPFVDSVSVIIAERGATTPLLKESGHADDDLIWREDQAVVTA